MFCFTPWARAFTPITDRANSRATPNGLVTDLWGLLKKNVLERKMPRQRHTFRRHRDKVEPSHPCGRLYCHHPAGA